MKKEESLVPYIEHGNSEDSLTMEGLHLIQINNEYPEIELHHYKVVIFLIV